MITTRHRSPAASSSGFTLVEIAFAVAILALAFTTIIAIQSNVTATAIADRNRFNAALFAQYLLTAADLKDKKPEPGMIQNALPDALRDAGWAEDGIDDHLQPYADWTVETDVQSISLLEIPDALRRVDIIVAWGKEDVSQFKVTYFAAGDGKPPL